MSITRAQMWRPQRRRLRQRQCPQRHLRPKCAKSAYWFHVVSRDGIALVPCGHAHFCSACADTVTGIVQIRLEE